MLRSTPVFETILILRLSRTSSPSGG
ncbi:hypothetical protein V3C99_018657 [Haemonchus contortus]